MESMPDKQPLVASCDTYLVGAEVGAAVGGLVGPDVGLLVGALVGPVVGAEVGPDVGSFVCVALEEKTRHVQP